jgi:hypothetical protein
LLLVVALVVSAVLFAREREDAEERASPATAPAAPAAAPRSITRSGSPAPAGAAASSSPVKPPPPPAPDSPAAPVVDEGYPVDLERIRAQIPRNLYWTDQAPTNDPEVLRRREADAAAWNVLHGKVISGTASDAEIRTWFDHRRQVSEDAIAFAERVLSGHASELPERDRGLLELAVDMHRTRLAELPRQEAEASARKAEQDRRRAEWQGRSPP